MCAANPLRPRHTLAAMLIILACTTGTLLAAENYLASPEAFIAKFGPPDAIETTANDNPRPPFVTKMLTYKKERVQFIFVADAKVGTPPPYEKWLLMGAIDIKKKTSLDPDTALNRLAHRRRF
jgi:hypothetical protein